MNEIQLKYGVIYVIYADGQPRPLIVEAATLSKAAVYAQEKVRDMATTLIMTGELAAEGVHYDILQVVRQGWEGKSMEAHAALTAQAEEAARKEPTEAELDAVRGYLIDVRTGSHTVGNMRVFARRYAGCDESDIPESWADLPDDAHVTKAMHAEVLWRAFRRAALKGASNDP